MTVGMPILIGVAAAAMRSSRYLRRESDGAFIGVGMCIVRGFAHTLDGVFFDLGYLWPIWDRKHQTFADKICGTVVVCS